jgi:hypothetical protein
MVALEEDSVHLVVVLSQCLKSPSGMALLHGSWIHSPRIKVKEKRKKETVGSNTEKANIWVHVIY